MKDIMKALSMLTQVGISMLVPILLCIWIGKYLDRTFDTGVTFLIIFIFLGVGSAFKTLYSMTVEKYKKEALKEQAEFDRLSGKNLVKDSENDENSDDLDSKDDDYKEN